MRAAIVGAGLVGRLLAWRLQQLGWQLDIFEKCAQNDQNTCSYTAAGMLAPIAELDKSDSSIAEMGLRSITLWQKWLSQLPGQVYFRQQGSLITAHQSECVELDHYHQRLQRFNIAENNAQRLDKSQLQQLEPALIETDQALFLPREAQLDNQALLNALYLALQSDKTQWHWQSEVTDLMPCQLVCHGKQYGFDWVFDCRGLAAKPDLVELRGMRGEVIWLNAPSVEIARPVRYLHPRYSIYIVPRPNQLYIIGASEIESEDQGPVSVRSNLELLTAAYSLHRGFAEARIIKMMAHCRPALPDHNPKIFYQPGLMRINGLFRHGFLIAPDLIEHALQVISGADSRLNSLVVIEEERYDYD